ncbi:hypothetical protein [Shinella sp.]|uniref:hypothetical protein n=1 Tax=Shinella sp. TaxID=1870904 RepID=UPI00301DDA97
MIHAIGDCVDQLCNGLLDLRQFRFPYPTGGEIGLNGLVVLPLVFLDKGGDEARVKELVAQAAENPIFQTVTMDHAAIVARRALAQP